MAGQTTLLTPLFRCVNRARSNVDNIMNGVELMKQFNHIDNVEWTAVSCAIHDNIHTKLLLDAQTGGSAEFIVTYTELKPGDTLPMHRHGHPHSDYFISGRAWAQLGLRKVEIEKDCATYFPAGAPHAYEAIGDETVRYYSVFACEKAGQIVKTERIDSELLEMADRPNMDETRWAVAESFETLQYWEPTKGPKGLIWTSLFDARRGGHKEMIVGTLFLRPEGRYSKHTHDQPEVFIGLEGEGILFCGEEEIPVKPGVAAYVGKKQVHGAQTTGDTTMKMIWVYGTEVADADWSWTPVEDIYLGAQPLKTRQ